MTEVFHLVCKVSDRYLSLLNCQAHSVAKAVDIQLHYFPFCAQKQFVQVPKLPDSRFIHPRKKSQDNNTYYYGPQCTFPLWAHSFHSAIFFLIVISTGHI